MPTSAPPSRGRWRPSCSRLRRPCRRSWCATRMRCATGPRARPGGSGSRPARDRSPAIGPRGRGWASPSASCRTAGWVGTSTSPSTWRGLARSATRLSAPSLADTPRHRAGCMDVQVNLPTPASALAIGAHPDDVEFGCGATLARWAAAGCVVHHLVCTDGSKGTWNPDQDLIELVAQRHDEQRAAAKALGAIGEVVFLDWPDGELESGLRQRWQVAYWIRRLRPEVVLGHDPWKRYRLHPDHRHAGFLAVDGVVAARDPHFFPEQDIAHHRPAALLLFEADEPDHVELADDEAVARKLAALEAHHSQLLSTMDVDLDSDEGEAQLSDFRSRVRQRLVAHGQIGGVVQGEAFKAITEL